MIFRRYVVTIPHVDIPAMRFWTFGSARAYQCACKGAVMHVWKDGEWQRFHHPAERGAWAARG